MHKEDKGRVDGRQVGTGAFDPRVRTTRLIPDPTYWWKWGFWYATRLGSDLFTAGANWGPDVGPEIPWGRHPSSWLYLDISLSLDCARPWGLKTIKNIALVWDNQAIVRPSNLLQNITQKMSFSCDLYLSECYISVNRFMINPSNFLLSSTVCINFF